MDFGIARAVADIDATMTADRRRDRHRAVPLAGAGPGREGRRPLRPLLHRLPALRAAHRRPPFTGDSPVAVAYQHVREDPVAAVDGGPRRVAAAIDAIVLKSLAKNPDNRYQSADEMRERHRAALDGRPVAARAADAGDREPQTQHTARCRHRHDARSRRRPTASDRDGRGGRALGYALLSRPWSPSSCSRPCRRRSSTARAAPDSRRAGLSGLTVADARQHAGGRGLEPVTEQPDDRRVTEGSVIDQNPEAGDHGQGGRRRDDHGVDRREVATVPSLVGLSLAEARQALNQAGLELGRADPVASDETRNTVVRVEPQAEAEVVPAGSSVDINVASGNNKVPNVVGQDERRLRAASSSRPASRWPTPRGGVRPTRQPGSVDPAAPAAKETSRLGSTVTIAVATAPPETPTPNRRRRRRRCRRTAVTPPPA